MNYVTGDRNPIYVDSSKIRTTPKRDEKLLAELDYIDKYSKVDKETGTIYLPPVEIIED